MHCSGIVSEELEYVDFPCLFFCCYEILHCMTYNISLIVLQMIYWKITIKVSMNPAYTWFLFQTHYEKPYNFKLIIHICYNEMPSA